MYKLQTREMSVPNEEAGILESEAEAMGLLKRVAYERDQAAYAALFERYQKPAFNLSYRILGNRDLAQEAVQECMLKVWRSASTFHWEGSVKSWIFCIVARESLQISQRKRMERSRVEALAGIAEESDAGGSSGAPELEEQLSMLRRLVDELPQLERQLLALCHGAGLTHAEIGASLSMPRRTVTQKIQKALDALRAGLARSGVAAVAPLLTPECLGEVIRSGADAPAGLLDSTLPRLDEAGLKAMSRRAVSAGSKAPLALACLLAIATSGGLLWYSQRPGPVAAPVPAALAEADEHKIKPEIPIQSGLADPQAPRATEETWQPFPTEPIQQFAYDTSSVKREHGFIFFNNNTKVDAYWQVHQAPDGPWVVQTKNALAHFNIILLGPIEEGGREVRGEVHYAGAEPEGQIHFVVSNGKEMHLVLAKHVPENRPSRFRILVWPDAQVLKCVSIREAATGKLGAHGQQFMPASPKFCVGFGTSTRVAFRNLQVRKLPLGWKPSDDSNLKPLLSIIEKVLSKEAVTRTPDNE